MHIAKYPGLYVGSLENNHKRYKMLLPKNSIKYSLYWISSSYLFLFCQW